jgi:hypothetical protein
MANIYRPKHAVVPNVVVYPMYDQLNIVVLDYMYNTYLLDIGLTQRG